MCQTNLLSFQEGRGNLALYRTICTCTLCTYTYICYTVLYVHVDNVHIHVYAIDGIQDPGP